MARIESWFRQDLKEPVHVQMIQGNVFSQDEQANLIGVAVTDGGEAAVLGGSVSASIIRADGATIAQAGTLEENRCFVVLPAAAYAVPGPLVVTLKLAQNGAVTTVLSVAATVYRSSTDAVVDPGTIIPSIQDLIDEIETVAASIPPDYTSMWEKTLYLAEKTENLVDVFNAEITTLFVNTGTNKVADNENVLSVIIPVSVEENTVVSINKRMASQFQVSTYTSAKPAVGVVPANVYPVTSSQLKYQITIGSSVKWILLWYYYSNNDSGKDPDEILDGITVVYGDKYEDKHSWVPYGINSPYLFSKVYSVSYRNNTIDFDDNTETGSVYINNISSGETLLHPPIDEDSIACILTNVSMQISSSRCVLQCAYIQAPVQYRGCMFYRLINADTKNVFADWANVDYSLYEGKITIFGDSISAGYPQLENYNYKWWSYLRKYFDIYNHAQSGSGLLYLSGSNNGKKFADDFDDSASSYLCIFMGTNDYGNDMPLGATTDASSANTVCGALRYIIEKVTTTVPAISIIGILPLNRSDYGTIDTNWAYGANNEATVPYTLGELCDALKAIYEEYGIPVIDNRIGVFQKNNIDSLLGDHLHPNITGYRRLAQHLAGEIMKIAHPI